MVKKSGFTIAEILIVISIITLLIAVSAFSYSSVSNRGKAAQASTTASEIKTAVLSYYADMGVFPAEADPNVDPDLVACIRAACTSQIVRWKGPYLSSWPAETPWKGEYDYNNGNTAPVPDGCTIPANIYVGIQPGTAGGAVSARAEDYFYQQGIDADGCPSNGSVQILIKDITP